MLRITYGAVVFTECCWRVTCQATVYFSDFTGRCSGHTYSRISSRRKLVCHRCKLQNSAHLSLSSRCRSEVQLCFSDLPVLHCHNSVSWLQHDNKHWFGLILIKLWQWLLIVNCIELQITNAINVHQETVDIVRFIVFFLMVHCWDAVQCCHFYSVALIDVCPYWYALEKMHYLRYMNSLFQLGFATRVNPNPKTRVTRSFFKPENPGLESLQTRVFGFEFWPTLCLITR